MKNHGKTCESYQVVFRNMYNVNRDSMEMQKLFQIGNIIRREKRILGGRSEIMDPR